MNNKPLVSLIIPVYNVEAYLRECLDSVINQSYSNLEIIIVNDGSTDGSLNVCEEYAAKDERIRVISQKNGGLSSARNTGLDSAKGLYIGFIDSDDSVHTTFVECLMDAISESKSRIAVCDFSSDIKQLANMDNGKVILSSNEAVSGLLDDFGYKCFAWNKIYQRECFDGVRFPKGKLFEDIILMYEMFKKTDTIIYVKQPLYFYRMRKGSITKAAFTQRNFHLLESIDYVLNDSRELTGLDMDRITLGYLSYFMGFVRRGLISKAAIKDEECRLRESIKRNAKLILQRNKYIKNTKKAELFVFAYMPFVYRIVISIL